MSLLSAGQKAQIRNAIKQVTDTFAVTPVTFYLTQAVIDRFNEERKNRQYAIKELSAFVEYGSESKDDRMAGDDYWQTIKLLFNLEDLEAAGCLDANYMPLFNPASDHFVVSGVECDILKAYSEGGLEAKNVLIIVEGKRRHQKA